MSKRIIRPSRASRILIGMALALLLLLTLSAALPVAAQASLVASGTSGAFARPLTTQASGPEAPAAPDAANLISDILGSARHFAVFHGTEPSVVGAGTRSFAMNNSVLWGNVGIGPGSATNFSGGSNVVGDCYEQPPASDPSKGCADLETNNLWTAGRDPMIYKNYTTDLSGVVTDIRNAVTYVRALPATQTIAGDLTAGTTINSSSCGSRT